MVAGLGGGRATEGGLSAVATGRDSEGWPEQEGHHGPGSSDLLKPDPVGRGKQAREGARGGPR